MAPNASCWCIVEKAGRVRVTRPMDSLPVSAEKVFL